MTNSNTNPEEVSLVDHIDERVSTDIISDIKSGIFNLFSSLYQQYSFQFGPEDGMNMSIEYLESIIRFFQDTLEENNKKNTNIH